jgi:NAD-dependent SIR2 family protein deacetylase
VKPDIVFFGETLPDIFMDNVNDDMGDCDLLIVMGTSLLVDPVASIPKWVGPKVPRLLINRELVGAFLGGGGIDSKKRDVFLQGDCDDGVRYFCKLLGDDWATNLDNIHTAASPTKGP